MADPMYRQIADDLRRQIETGNSRPAASLATRDQAAGAVPGLTQHGPRCDQGADDPRAGGDQTRPGHVRRATDPAVRGHTDPGAGQRRRAGNGPQVRAVLGHPQTPRGGEVRIEISLARRVARELQLTGEDTIVSLASAAVPR